jgi:hypothetical protein
MTGEFDAFGGLATAALAAREIDRGPLHDPGEPGHCANCEALVTDRFCAHCGQPAHVHRSLLHVAEEFLHGITHFDGKAWKTLPMLVINPGKLTYDYVHGRRARYIAPVALFLLTVFLMFFAFSFTNIDTLGGSGDKPKTDAERAATVKATDNAVVQIRADLAKAQAASHATPGQITALQATLAGAEIAQRNAHNAVQRAAGVKTDDDEDLLPSKDQLFDDIRNGDSSGQFKFNTGHPTLDAHLHHAAANPELTFYKMQQKAYKFSFLLVPLSLPVLWLLFPFRRHVYLYDHAVFSLYSISFMSLLFVVISAMAAFGVQSQLAYSLLVGLVPPLHMYAQLKGAYRLGRFGAMWRASVLAVAAIVTLSVFVAFVIVIGLVE